MQDHSALWNELRSGVTDLRDDMNRRFGEVRTGFDDLRVDMDRRFGDVRAEVGQMRVELHRLDNKVDRHFLWLAGTLITSTLVMMGAVVGLYFK